jgi:hypothetical protein
MRCFGEDAVKNSTNGDSQQSASIFAIFAHKGQ